MTDYLEYLEDYLQSIEYIPSDVQEAFVELGTKDKELHGLAQEIRSGYQDIRRFIKQEYKKEKPSATQSLAGKSTASPEKEAASEKPVQPEMDRGKDGKAQNSGQLDGTGEGKPPIKIENSTTEQPGAGQIKPSDWIRAAIGDSSSTLRRYQDIQTLYQSALEISDQKVELIDKVLRMIDKNISRLATDMGRMNQEPSSEAAAPVLSTPPQPQRKDRVLEKSSSLSSLSSNKRKVSKLSAPRKDRTPKKREDSGESDQINIDDHEVEHPMEGEGEPLYCYCRGVSYGEMIGCDAEDCPNEWFHLDCVGLDEPPKGVWYCNDCRERYKKKKVRG
ncbi:uncharacterized protein BJ171DRAFT_578322 [Polychytrium aggregatum]|uniref:uncharacterized protein n=1 Tax=Polychytrium aggregatum TaxID=110093 RepID=UPI0022FE4B72|nr:uncharacterized protein BJ171DRAFT_578322 [Polychytrium aggregatum]KAI9207855.1 hypothetical protein BJ171DRAFT_578322 [Polychytrium aggregatum]